MCIGSLFWFAKIIIHFKSATLIHKIILIYINLQLIPTALALFYLILRSEGKFNQKVCL